MIASKTVAPLIGKTFGDLVVTGEGPRKGHHARAMCRCKCGHEWPVRPTELRRGATKRCRMCRRTTTTHGLSASPEYTIWLGMIRRCSKTTERFRNYGGRGISVCKRWKAFENFYADMGPRPSARHSIDRYPNNDGNYEPDNCRWATPHQQAANTRKNTLVRYKRKVIIAAEFSRLTGIRSGLVCKWIRLGLNASQMIARDRDKPHLRLLTADGKTMTLRKWSKHLMVNHGAIRGHLVRGKTMQGVVDHYKKTRLS